MLKKSLQRIKSEFGFLAEEDNEVEQNIMNRLDRSVKLDEVDTITFGLETDDGKIVKVYVKVDQSEDFEKALAKKLGEIDDIEEVLNELSKEFEIIDVEWPSEDPSSDDEDSEDGSDSLDKKVYDNPREQGEKGRDLKPKLEGLSIGERFMIGLNENSESIESRFTTVTQLMVYQALLELGVPEVALSRGAYRTVIIKRIKEKAIELTHNSAMKNALKMFINRSIDYDDRAEKNLRSMGGKNLQDSNNIRDAKESLNEDVTQDFWSAFLELVNYVASTPETAKDFLSNPTMKQIMSRSEASITSKVTPQMKMKLNDFKTSLSNDSEKNQLKAAGVVESYLLDVERLNEGASPVEISDLFRTMLMLADPSKDGTVANNVMKSSAWNSFFNSAKSSFSQKFSGIARAKLNQLKAVLPVASVSPIAAKDNSVTSPVTTPGVKSESKGSFIDVLRDQILSEVKPQRNAELAHDYSYGAEKFESGHPIEVIGEEGDSYIVKPFPIMAKSHIKLKKSDVKLTGKINVPDGGPGGEMKGGLNESPDPLKSFTEWTFDMDGDNLVIQSAVLKIHLNPEEIEKLVKGITNKDTVIVRDEEDPTHKVAFSPRGYSIMVKKVGTTSGVMMRTKDIDNLLDFVSKGEPDKSSEETASDEKQPSGGDESALPKDQVKA